MEKRRNAYKVWVGKPKGKRPRRRWGDISKTDLKEIALDVVECIRLAHDRGKWQAVVNTAVNHSVA